MSRTDARLARLGTRHGELPGEDSRKQRHGTTVRRPVSPPVSRTPRWRTAAGNAPAPEPDGNEAPYDLLGVNEAHTGPYWSLVQLTSLLRSYEVGARW